MPNNPQDEGPSTGGASKMKSSCKTRVRSQVPSSKEDSDSAPKHSTATDMKFRVMRQCLGRLQKENKDLSEISGLFQEALQDVEKEIQVVQVMRDMAFKSWEFQLGADEDTASDQGSHTPMSIEASTSQGDSRVVDEFNYSPASPE